MKRSTNGRIVQCSRTGKSRSDLGVTEEFRDDEHQLHTVVSLDVAESSAQGPSISIWASNLLLCVRSKYSISERGSYSGSVKLL